MTNPVKVQLNYQYDTILGTFSDSIYYPFNEYLALPADVIEAEKAIRFDNWIASMIADPVEHSKEDVLEWIRLEKERLESALQSING